MRRKGIGGKAGRVWKERGGGRGKDLAEGLRMTSFRRAVSVEYPGLVYKPIESD